MIQVEHTALFKKFDLNGDGKLSTVEYDQLEHDAPASAADSQPESQGDSELVAQADKDGDKKLSLAEFLAHSAPANAPTPDGEMSDKDKDAMANVNAETKARPQIHYV